MKRDTDNGFIEVGFKPENVTSKPSVVKPTNGDRDISEAMLVVSKDVD